MGAETTGYILADFERLIRKALASQDDGSAEVRQVVYRSSRNALQKIIDGNRSLTVENAMAQKKGLEDCIEKIEQEYLAPPPPEPVAPQQFEQVEQFEQAQQEPAPVIPPDAEIAPEPMSEPIQQTPEPVIPDPVLSPAQTPVAQPGVGRESESAVRADPLHSSHPLDEIQQILAGSPSPNKGTIDPPLSPQPQAGSQSAPERAYDPVLDDPMLQNDLQAENRFGEGDKYYDQAENVPLGFKKRRKTQKRIFWTIINLVVLGLLGWIIYIVATSFLSGSLFEKSDGAKSNPNNVAQQNNTDNYINILNAGDTTTLEIAGRGRAEIVNQLNTEMIRVNSVRDEANRDQPAQPILIKLNPGVLQQISGKRVTVELFAKSGGGDQAHFAVGCEFGGLTECGRKRFLAGPQPSASVFAFQMDQIPDTSQEMYLTLSTDTTGEASVTGDGDVLDIVYVRLSVDP